MASSDVDVEIVVVDSDIDEADDRKIDEAINTKSSTMVSPLDISKTFVSARTDGIRGKRYTDYEIGISSGLESGEITDSDGDIVVVGDSDKDNKADSSLNVLDEGIVSSRNTSRNKSPKFNAKSSVRPPAVHEIDTSEDVKDILSRIKAEPVEQETNYGISQLLADHRQINPIDIDSSDEGLNFNSDSESSDESDYHIPMSVTSEICKMEKMKIKDHYSCEVYPEVDIIDLTLSASEEIIPLGTVYRIVDDFVVVNCSDRNKILDLDSMIFDMNRKCVGYIFEVLGPVMEPFYSIRFNTQSDIASFGLHLGQQLFYSTNERYSRYILVDLLRDLEQHKHYNVKTSEGCSSDSFDSSESDSENIEGKSKKSTVGVKRKPKQQLKNRTTCNYSVKYQSVKQPKYHYNSFNDQWKNVSTSEQRSNSSGPTKYKSFVKTDDEVKNSFTQPEQIVYARSKPQSTNSFQSSVLASFLDPFSLDNPAD